MAITVYKRAVLLGGGAEALDNIDGDDLLDGDLAFVTVSGSLYVYELDDSSGAAEASPSIIAPDANAGTKRWLIQRLPTDSSVPIGAVVPFVGGYFGSGGQTGFTNVIGNSASVINTLLNGDGWYVCDGSALNSATSSIFNGSGRYLPDLTDKRFLMGDTEINASAFGGSSSMAHTHTTPDHTLTTAELAAHQHTTNALTSNVTGTGAAGTNLIPYSAGGKTVAAGSGDAHNHGTTGAASVTENRPLYMKCFYIMKAE